MPKPFFLLLICCLICHVAVCGESGTKATLPERQQDPVEVHWYNTQDSVFELRTAAQLRGLAELVNLGIDFYQQEVRLANDIFLNDTTGWRDWEHDASGHLEPWIPIGKEDNPFSGTFDGKGYTIFGLYINKGMESYYQGFFGLVLDGHIQHVHLQSFHIRAHDHIGGIAGMIGYTSEIRGCTSHGKIIGRGHMVGGIVGKAEEYNRIIDCGNMGDIQGQRRVGGIAGSFEYGELYNCFNRGYIKARHEYVGGLVGMVLGGQFGERDTNNWEWAKGVVRVVEKRRKVTAKELRYTFANNYNSGTVEGEYKIGGLAGSFLKFVDRDPVEDEKKTDVWDILGFRQLAANNIRAATIKGRYFSNCYNTGQIKSRFAVNTDGLIGHYDWDWQTAVHLLDERQANSYWSDSSVVVAKVETAQLPRNIRSFDNLQEIYSVRPPKGFGEVKDDKMRSEEFVAKLNTWVEEQGRTFHHWRPDYENINGGYPVFEPEGE